jgi:hypothetical protein
MSSLYFDVAMMFAFTTRNIRSFSEPHQITLNEWICCSTHLFVVANFREFQVIAEFRGGEERVPDQKN